ncbi:FecCD family ABC transporter permease [Paenibacillus sp. SN-8-1]|uniref:FecCD family ABC transporter permease n=1 Tax=Paenibacillus sp. SN-8-1 TaxID=3435409 RepID=UPI003D9A94B4
MSRVKIVGLVPLLFLVLLASIIWSVSTGALPIPFLKTVATLFGGGDEQTRMLIFKLRLPRVLVAAMVGAGLAVSGTILQAIFRNPLSAPDIVGINGGASVAAVAFLTLMKASVSIHWLPVAAFGGALTAAALIYILAYTRNSSPLRLILVGVGISSAASALTTFLLISGDSYRADQILNWLTGTVYGKSMEHAAALLPWIVIFIPLAWGMSRHLNVMLLGDTVAMGVGSAVERTRLVLLLIAVCLAASSVSVAGGIAFIGLMAPHIGRRLAGNQHAGLITVSALIGAILLVLADLAGRTLFAPKDLPAGIFTAALGAPFFFYLFFKNNGTSVK